MTDKEILVLYVRIIELAYSQDITSDDYPLYKQFVNLLNTKDYIKMDTALNTDDNNLFQEINILDSLFKVHSYIETIIGKKIRDFDELLIDDIKQIQDSLGKLWNLLEKK